MIDLSAVDLEELAMALGDQNGYDHHWLIDPDSGRISLWTEDGGIDGEHPIDLDEVDLIGIHPLPSYVWYQDMADFADGISDERAGRRFARAIRGKGAFRRFKDELHEEYPDLLPAWYAFRDARAQRRAVEWLVDNDIVDETQAQNFLAEHPGPDLPQAVKPVGRPAVRARSAPGRPLGETAFRRHSNQPAFALICRGAAIPLMPR